MERNREQSLLRVAAFDPAADVEKGAPLAAGEADDPPWALDDVEAAGLTLRLRQVDRLVEAGGNLPEAVFGALRTAGGRRHQRGEDSKEDHCSDGAH